MRTCAYICTQRRIINVCLVSYIFQTVLWTLQSDHSSKVPLTARHSPVNSFPIEAFVCWDMSLDELSMHRLGLAFVYRLVPVIIVSILYGKSISLYFLHSRVYFAILGVYIAVLCSATSALMYAPNLTYTNSTYWSTYLILLSATEGWELQEASPSQSHCGYCSLLVRRSGALSSLSCLDWTKYCSSQVGWNQMHCSTASTIW